MWFKNLRVYRLTRPIDLSAATLESKLAERPFTPCGKVDFSKSGFVPALGPASTELSHRIEPFALIVGRRQEKILPPAAINEVLEQKIFELEASEGRPARRREKTTLKEDVIQSLLPRALTRSSRIHAYFDTKRDLLIVDAASASQAEIFLDMLRATLGELPVIPLSSINDLAETMTHWLQTETPGDFFADGECELRAAEDARNVVRCRHQELESDEVRMHLKAGKRVTQIALNWRDALRFVLTEDFVVKRLRFADRLKEDVTSDDQDDATRFDMEFAAMTLEIGALLEALVDACGGYSED